MNAIRLKRKSSSKTVDSLDTNFSENISLNNSVFENKKKSVSFNMKIDIIPVQSFKIRNRDNSFSTSLILQNLKKKKKKQKENEEIYVPKEQNCIACSIF